MLEVVDLEQQIDKKEYRRRRDELEAELGRLQRQITEAGVSVVVVLEGWGGVGKGEVLNSLILPLDPRGFSVHIPDSGKPWEEDPFLRWYWTRVPARGEIALFTRSWYGRVLATGRSEGYYRDGFEAVNAFERQLAAEGTVMVKLFCHVDRKEQKKRLKKRREDPKQGWTVTRGDLKQVKERADHEARLEETLQRTDTAWAPWHVIPAGDLRFAAIEVMTQVKSAMEAALEAGRNPQTDNAAAVAGTETGEESIARSLDAGRRLEQEEYKRERKRWQKRVHAAQVECYRRGIPVVIAFEGWDAAGKGGCIKRLTKAMDPRGYEVIPVGAPTPQEKVRHYLWRFWRVFPEAGHIHVFDRSWYGRVLVERVEGFATSGEWKRAYREINQMERQFVQAGAPVIKFWLQIDPDEQLRRFESRQSNPGKQWKITDEDWRNRSKWEDYARALDDMLLKTSTTYAPWTVVEADDKRYARVKVLRTVVERLEAAIEAGASVS